MTRTERDWLWYSIGLFDPPIIRRAFYLISSRARKREMTFRAVILELSEGHCILE